MDNWGDRNDNIVGYNYKVTQTHLKPGGLRKMTKKIITIILLLLYLSHPHSHPNPNSSSTPILTLFLLNTHKGPNLEIDSRSRLLFKPFLPTMESFGGFGFGDASKTVRKKRSNSSRRPRNDSQPLPDYRDNSSLSSTPPSDNASKASSDDNTGQGTNSRRKELNLNQCSSRASSSNLAEAETAVKANNEDGIGESSDVRFKSNSERKHSGIDSKRSSEGVLAPANWKSTNKVKEDGPGTDNKLKKVKLKVGGVTRTIHPTSTSDGASLGGSSSTKSSRSSDALRPRQKLILQDMSDEDRSPSPDKGSGLHGVPWKDFSRSGFSVRKVDSSRGKMTEESVSIKQSDKHEPVRKSKRVPKRRLLDGAFDDGDDDDEEIRYLEKLKTTKVATDYGAENEDEDEVGSKKQRKISRVLKKNVDGGYKVDEGDYGLSRSGKEGKKSRSGRYEDTDYVEEEEVSDAEPETNKKKQRKEFH
ncbi:hypothetical protein F0562_020038 [Nyssa sinensis]|uniref:Uncharacterized protein n=1 Tax=Nyssa sinensis TaxID=561372 RepID=A0A5J5BRD8_9ASTE|nr:hypothetical protein F0562_020038 [Nyssa sinensis]